MESDGEQSSSVKQAIMCLQVALEEQSQSFKELAGSIRSLTTGLDQKNSESSIAEKEEAEVNEEERIRSQV